MTFSVLIFSCIFHFPAGMSQAQYVPSSNWKSTNYEVLHYVNFSVLIPRSDVLDSYK